jgi:hypothetical protein
MTGEVSAFPKNLLVKGLKGREMTTARAISLPQSDLKILFCLEIASSLSRPVL